MTSRSVPLSSRMKFSNALCRSLVHVSMSLLTRSFISHHTLISNVASPALSRTFPPSPAFSTTHFKFNLEVQIQFGGWGGGVVRFMDDSSTSITSFTTFTRISPLLPAFSPLYPQKSPLSPKFHQHLPKFHHIHHIYPHLPAFTHMWHHSAAPPNTDTLIKISETEIFTQCAGRVVSKLNPNFDLQISTVKLNLDPGTKFEICPKFSTRHSKLKFEGSKFILEGDH